MSLSPLEQELARPGGPSIITVVDMLLTEGYRRRASDVHVHPERGGLRVRMRVDGVLWDAFCFPSAMHAEMIARLKVLAGMRTDEHAAAQDGRIRRVLEDGTAIDVRVSVLPTHFGENAVLRLLDVSAGTTSLADLGFGDFDRRRMEEAMTRPHGMVLVTGPTGSGKTTTLHAMLRLRAVRTASLVTLEDPIERELDGVTQIPVRERNGLGFAAGLRAVLRQDPDVIMVGEIRDAETANVAVNAALTGHLLLSTLHTNDAASAVMRMAETKVEPHLLASTLSMVVAQRLVRRTCQNCGEERMPNDIEAPAHATIGLLPNERCRKGRGCRSCNGSGYMGRICLNETLAVSDALRTAISQKAAPREIAAIAIAEGMVPMREDGLRKVRAGLTTPEEIIRITP